MTALQWIVKEAKKIKKEYPKRFSKWTEYVAQASAIYAKKHHGKSPVGKKHKKVGAIKKKAAPKKKHVVKKSAVKSYHKDTKSHNVNIRVVSGIKNKKYNVMAIVQKTNGLHERLGYYYFDKLTDAKKCFNSLKNILKEKKERGIYTVEIVNVENLKQVKVLNWIKL